MAGHADIHAIRTALELPQVGARVGAEGQAIMINQFAWMPWLTEFVEIGGTGTAISLSDTDSARDQARILQSPKSDGQIDTMFALERPQHLLMGSHR